MHRDPQKLLQEATAQRARIRPPAWTLRVYNWWYANTANPPRRETENLCRYFWIPVRAAGLWVKLRIGQHLSTFEQLLVLFLLVVYVAFIAVGVAIAGTFGLVVAVIAVPVALWLLIGTLIGWVAQKMGNGSFDFDDDPANHHGKLDRLLRPSMIVGSELQKFTARSAVRSALKRWGPRAATVLGVLFVLGLFAAIIIEFGWLRFLIGVGLIVAWISLVVLGSFLWGMVSPRIRRKPVKQSGLRETADFTWAFVRAKKMKICPFVDVSEHQAS